MRDERRPVWETGEEGCAGAPERGVEGTLRLHVVPPALKGPWLAFRSISIFPIGSMCRRWTTTSGTVMPYIARLNVNTSRPVDEFIPPLMFLQSCFRNLVSRVPITHVDTRQPAPVII